MMRIAPAGVPEVHSWVPRHAFPPFVEEKLLAIRREVSGSGPVEPGEVLLCRGAGWAAVVVAAVVVAAAVVAGGG